MAEKTPGKKPKRRCGGHGDKPTAETPTAYLVSADGTDADIAARFAEDVPGWADWSARDKKEAVRLMRAYWLHPDAASLTVTRDDAGGLTIGPKHKVTLAVLRLADAFASGSQEFVDGRVGELGQYHRTATGAGLTDGKLNDSLAFVAGGGAQDTVQAALLTQMAATHAAAMQALSRIGGAEVVEQVNTFANISTKLLNAYTRQAETLTKLQRGAEQTVRHVYVDARTQTAINCPPAHLKTEVQSHAQNGCGAFGPAMLGYDPAQDSVPVPGDLWPAALPDARREGRGTARQ